MTWSLSEIEGLARKAARGAGFSWGMADEAGKAVRWLSSVGLPGAEALAEFLDAHDRTPHAAMCPQDVSAQVWTAQGGVICPISAGTALCDLARSATPCCDIDIPDCAYPLLLVPFVAGAAEDGGTALRISWKGGDFAIAADLRGGASAPLRDIAPVTIRRGAAPHLPLPECQLRYDLAPEFATRLTALAHRTYAPDTEESRVSGAGAGLSDND